MAKRTGIAQIALVAGMILSAGPALAEDAPVKIGAIQPMTGELQAYGETSLNAIRTAVAQINAQGGILGGRQVELVVGDSQTTAQAGVETARRMVDIDHVAGIIGALASGVTIPIASSVTAPAGVVQISGASTSPVITTLEDNDFLFRTIPTDALQGVVLADLLREKGLERVGVIYVNNDYGKGLANAFSDAFAAKGGEVTQSVAYTAKQPSYRGEIRNAARGGAEALVLIAYPEDGITILKQSVESGSFSRFVMTDGMKSDSVIEAVGAEALQGSFGTVPQSDTTTPAYQAWVAGYAAEFGSEPADPFMDSDYDATFLLGLAIEKAGTATDGAAIRDALREVASAPGEVVGPGEWEKAIGLIHEGVDIDYQGAAGSQDFDADGDVPGTYGIWEIRDGKFVTDRIVAPQME
jgi:ABC-type branched-subunit amino acid transport system substrate-binding protein